MVAMGASTEVYVGVYYPRRAQMVDNGLPGYVIGALEHMVVAEQLIGKPVTYEHRGIEDACKMVEREGSSYASTNVVRALERSSLEDVLRSPIGTIEDAWEAHDGRRLCSFAIDAKSFPRLSALIHTKGLHGLSLSHLHGSMPQALEVSLCTTPARPGCYVVAGPFCVPSQVHDYKALTQMGPQLTTMSQAAAPEPVVAVTMESALAGMTAEHRSLISAAFGDMNAKLETTQSENALLNKKYDMIEKSAQIDKKLLSAQIDTFLSQLDDSTKAQFNLNTETCAAAIVNEDDANTMRRAVDRMLMCCNKELMSRRVPDGGGASSSKRKREEATIVPTDTHASNGRAEKSFEPASDTGVSPSTELRNALQLFN
jgi:hypothetical protein